MLDLVSIPMAQSATQVNLLLGGGIDSTALIAYYISRKASVRGIHFNYGQPSLVGESLSVSMLSQHYSIPVTTVDLGISIASTQGEYHCRNALLLLAAASVLHVRRGILAIGIHSGTPYYDCSLSFMTDIQRLLDGYFGGAVQVEAPFIELTKKDIFDFCQLMNVPIKMTFSCERRGDFPCSECPSCKDRRMLDESFRNMQSKNDSTN